MTKEEYVKLYDYDDITFDEKVECALGCDYFPLLDCAREIIKYQEKFKKECKKLGMEHI